MKKFIHKINTYLIENHPTIWNTRLVWMLITALGFHIIFFILGYVALSNPETLHSNRARYIFLENGSVFMNVIISVLMLVIWLIYLLKNNAFKNFYPTTRLTLFKHYISYTIIILFSITFFISHAFGLKAYINNTYDDERLNWEIQTANDAALFFSEKLNLYTIDNRKYPEPFDSLHCIKRSGAYSREHVRVPTKLNLNDDRNTFKHPYEDSGYIQVDACLTFLDKNYCFYTLKQKEGHTNHYSNDSTFNNYLFYKQKDSTTIYYFKDSIYNITNHVKSANPTYYNHSKTFYISQNDTLSEYEKITSRSYNDPTFSIRNTLRNKRNHALLKRKDANEIKQLLSNYLLITDSYKIKKNLTADAWFKLVYNPANFELKAFIRTEPKPSYVYGEPDIEKMTQEELFYKNHATDFYIENDNLNQAFENIEDIKSFNPFSDIIHFFIWFTIFLSTIIFMFRITGLKVLLFSAITISVLGIFITLLITTFEYLLNFGSNGLAYFVSYLTLIIGTIILAIPIFYLHKLRKTIVAICLNISIIGFVGYILLLITIISLHQTDNCTYRFDESCFNLLESLGFWWSYILLIIHIIFIYFYSKTIKNWKALPEG